MKELFIHIGLSKTGTSAIQSWLSLNTEQLKSQGIDYADLSPSAKNGEITAGNGVALFHACNDRNWEEVEQLILETYFKNNSKAIISSETLQSLPIEVLIKIKEICDKINVKCIVVAYARSVYELLYSNYLQGIKRHGFTFKFGERESLNYKAQRNFLNNYSNIFNSNLKVINYDSVKKDIFTSFANELTFNIEEFKIKDKKVNRSLTFEESDVLREMNILHKGKFSTAISDFLIKTNPLISTPVFYNNLLLDEVRENAKDDIFWINKNLKPKEGPISIDFSHVIQPNNNNNKEKENIISNIVDWCLCTNPFEKDTDFVNFIRDFAVYLEDTVLEHSVKLMEKANYLRPSGMFIKNKLEAYRQLLNAKN
jgi:hypothetical protein